MKPHDLFYYIRVTVLGLLLLTVVASVHAQGKKTFPLGKPIPVTGIMICKTLEGAKSIAEAQTKDVELASIDFMTRMMTGECGQVKQTVMVSYDALVFTTEGKDAEGDIWRVYSFQFNGKTYYEFTNWKHQTVDT